MQTGEVFKQERGGDEENRTRYGFQPSLFRNSFRTAFSSGSGQLWNHFGTALAPLWNGVNFSRTPPEEDWVLRAIHTEKTSAEANNGRCVRPGHVLCARCRFCTVSLFFVL